MPYRLKHAVMANALVLAVVIQLLWPAGRQALVASEQIHAPEPAQNHRYFLPITIRPFGAPEFTISQPRAAWTISGMLFFAVEPLNPGSVQSVTFRAGQATLGTDATAADGFHVFADASSLPAGPLQLSAVATGLGGSATQSLMITVVPDPPASATVGSGGAVVATAIGSTITVPPGALPAGTQVSVVERSQAEVTAKHGFDWDRQGVTFLGAQELTTGASPAAPLGISSAGFGNRVQPRQAVVNYQLFPDGDGDGVSELVVVNGASVAPNNDVISNPVVPVVLGTAVTPLRTAGTSAGSAPAALGGPPGTLLEIPASGLNQRSVFGTIAVYRSTVDSTIVEAPASIRSAPDAALDQIVVTPIPRLPAGPATLRIVNASTGLASAPIALDIVAAPPLVRPRKEIIDEGLAQFRETIQALNDITPETGWTDVTTALSETLAKTDELSAWVADASVDTTTDEALVLDTLAMYFQNANIPAVAALSRTVAPEQASCERDEATILGLLGGLGATGALLMGTAGFVLTVAALTPPVGTAILLVSGFLFGMGFSFSAASILASALVLLICRPDPPPKMCPGTGPATSLEDVIGGSNLAGIRPAQTGGGQITTGMGSAPITGGEACGNAPTLPDFGSSQPLGGDTPSSIYAGQAGRIVVRILTGVTPLAFSGVTDAAGYFYIPLLPAGEPFTAIAHDRQTGRVETIQGIGPRVGESINLFFDFLSPGDEVIPIETGKVVSGTIEPAGDVDVYSFSGAANDWVVIRLLDVADGALEPMFTLSGPDNTQICTRAAGSLPLIWWTCRLRVSGLQTLVIADKAATNTGDYRFSVERPGAIPNATALAFNQVVSGTLPLSPGMTAFRVPSGAEDFLHIRVLNQGSGQPRTDLGVYRQSGDSGCLGSGGGFLLLRDCPASESALLLVGDEEGGSSPFRIFAQSTKNPVGAEVLNFAETITRTIAVAPGAGTYTFTGTGGDKVAITMQEVDGTIAVPQLTLYRPDGFDLCDRTGLLNASQVVLTCTLPDGGDGRYTVIAGDGRGTGAGRYTMRLEHAGP